MVRVSRLNETSAICEYRYLLPVCGSNGPPGLSQRADGSLANCGYSAGGSTPLVVTNDELLSWLFAPPGPLRPQESPSNGLPMPSRPNVLPFSSNPSPTICTMPPNQYCRTSLTPSPPPGDPRSCRQRRGSHVGFAGRHGPSFFGSKSWVPTPAP